MLAFNRKTGVFVLLRSLFSQHPWKMAIVMTSMTLSSLTQGFGIALMAPLLSLIGFQGPTTTGRMVTLILKLLHGVHLPMTVPTVLLLFLVLVVIENTLKFFEMSYSNKFVFNFAEELRN